ncbi:MAG: hypothetical protein V7785_25200 [Bermanella sp.]|jgi:hypothetical protein
MTDKLISGQIRKIESKVESKTFFDFEFVAESDEDTCGLLCLVQHSNPKNMFITLMNPQELSISNDVQGLEAVKNRVVKETGVADLVSLKIIRFDQKKGDVKGGFQDFLKTYEKPIPVYESIFDKTEEAIQVGIISVNEFEKLGGKLYLLGNINMLFTSEK